ncbi:MAG: hypothetical protein KIS87_03325 [Phycisphaeraceae bacterium]|nr:hypothetical protein [Phycisphaeraceae bacterium]
MLWSFGGRGRLLTRAEIARREHERWLNRAIASGTPYPRIPTRLVRRGGFSGLMARPGGPERAARWWDAALARVDELGG